MLPEILRYVVDSFEGNTTSELPRDKKKVARYVINIIKQAEDPLCTVDLVEEDVLEEDEYVDDEEDRGKWDAASEWVANNPNKVLFGKKWIDCADVEKAVEAYGKKPERRRAGTRKDQTRPLLGTIRREFPFLQSKHHLQKLTDFEKLGRVEPEEANMVRYISTELLKQVKEEMEKGTVLHDEDLTDMALTIKRKKGIQCDFNVSHSWLNNWKREHGFSSRKITRFVAKRNHRNRDQLQKASEDFVAEARNRMANYGLEAVVNCDQSGVQLELYTNRTLAQTGSKKVEIAVNSVSATTHSYTIMPVFAANGTLYPKLFVVLKEPNGKFPQRGHFMASNLVVRAHSSHIMTKQLMIDFMRECIFDNGLPDKVLMVVDSWSTWKDKDTIDKVTPPNKTLEMLTIPPGCTGLIQPSDVSYFGVFKKTIKKIHAVGRRVAPNYAPGKRDNILKVVSLVHWLFCAPSMQAWLSQAWKTGGYVSGPLPQYKTGYQQIFPRNVAQDCEENGCDNTSMIRCVYCENFFCFDCFFEMYHKCC